MLLEVQLTVRRGPVSRAIKILRISSGDVPNERRTIKIGPSQVKAYFGVKTSREAVEALRDGSRKATKALHMQLELLLR